MKSINETLRRKVYKYHTGTNPYVDVVELGYTHVEVQWITTRGPGDKGTFTRSFFDENFILVEDYAEY